MGRSNLAGFVSSMRRRSHSYSPSPSRSYRRRGRSPSPRGHYGGHGRDLPTSLLVRNLRHGCKPDDLRKPFGQFGPLKDVYLPLDYYTREPRGFGFVQYVDPADAAEAKYQMDGQILFGRELTVVYAEENRKKPADMRARERGSGRSYDNRRSPRNARSPRHSRSQSPRYSRSPRYGKSQSRSHYSPSPRKRNYSPSPKQREYSRSISPDQRAHRERSYSRSPIDNRSKSRSPPYDEEQRGQSLRERSRSLSQ